MPTVLRVDGFAFRFYAGDHEPPHVHVSYGGDEVVLAIETAEVRKPPGMRLPDVRRAQELVREHQRELMAAWLAWNARKKEEANGGEDAH